jgi:hypothetical protein
LIEELFNLLGVGRFNLAGETPLGKVDGANGVPPPVLDLDTDLPPFPGVGVVDLLVKGEEGLIIFSNLLFS